MHPDNITRYQHAGYRSPRWRILSTFFALAFSSITAHAAGIRLTGPGTSWENVTILTNSVTCEALLTEPGHTILATSESDSELALLPDWDTWRDLPDARLDIWIETTADSSNVVSVLLGNTETPALVVSCADDWVIHPAGAAPPDPTPASYGVITQALHIALHPGTTFGQGVSIIRSRGVDGLWRNRPDLALTSFGWHDPEQAIPNWTQVGVALAGPEAVLLSLRMRWAPDATIMIFR